MGRRHTVELFEEIRRGHELGGRSIRALSEEYGVHRRTVRAALASALPPVRKAVVRQSPKGDQVSAFIDGILTADVQAPRKQRHTAHRIYERICVELPDVSMAERTVRQYVQRRKHALGVAARQITVPQEYQLGQEAQVDWYEATVQLDGCSRKMQFFTMRSMASGAAFHRAYFHATQQAFLEAHEYAFAYFGGVFARLRYDNLSSAVKRILRGSKREETARFVAFRSHWRFEATFCTPAQGHEKGGVEGEVGRFRRNHLVPVPSFTCREECNAYLLQACRNDWKRRINERDLTVGEVLCREQSHLQPLAEGFDLAEESFCVVDGKGCVQVRTNFYSTPLRAGARCRVRLLPATVEVWHEGRCVAKHERCYLRRQQILELEHYLDVLLRKPGALAGSRPLAQWRVAGRWTAAHDTFWQHLQQRHGPSEGTRLMIEVIRMGSTFTAGVLSRCIERALELGTYDIAAIRYLLEHDTDAAGAAPSITLSPADITPGIERYYQRPLPELAGYDALLATPAGVEMQS